FCCHSVKVNLIQQLVDDIFFFLLGHYRTPPLEYHICEPFTHFFLQGPYNAIKGRTLQTPILPKLYITK
ncbi:MAG: hypothetical protein K6G18_06530, partial [Treponema sp.]|nr:hypothetical protein [Treponema sp.]